MVRYKYDAKCLRFGFNPKRMSTVKKEYQREILQSRNQTPGEYSAMPS